MTYLNCHKTNALRSTLSVVVSLLSFSMFASVDCLLEADFDYSTFNHTVFFDEISGNDNSGAVTSWHWDFGDGNESVSPAPIYAYANYGTYTCCLTVTTVEEDGTECSNTICKLVILAEAEPCLVESHFDHIALENGKYQFNEDCVANDFTSVTEFHWEFGDGTTSFEANPLHVFQTNGHFNVCLTVTGSQGTVSCSDVICMDVDVDNFLCEVEPAVKVRQQTGCGINFINYTAAYNFTSVVSYSWDFGDGNYSTESSPMHFYAENGTYEVCLTVLAESPGNSCEVQYCTTIELNCDADETHQQTKPSSKKNGSQATSSTKSLDAMVTTKMYPNPSQGQVNLQVEKDLSYNIYSAAGVLVLTGSLYQGVNRLDLQELQKGIYLVEYTDGATSETKRLVLQ
jgi:PKD repeat protein